MKINQTECREFIIKKLLEKDVDRLDAEGVANVLVEAELRKDPSHGVSCLSKIIGAINSGDIVAGRQPKIINENKGTVLLDCKNVLGPIAGRKAMELAISKAVEFGVGAVSLKESHHLFTLGYYVKIAAEKDVIGIVTTSTAPAIFAPGGLNKVLGTNPIAFGFPSLQNPVIVDMSSTNVARGKIREAVNRGEKIPTGWGVDKSGKETNNPEEALEGALQPLGGHKGFGLALAIDILSGVLSGSASGKNVYGTSMHANLENKKTAFKGDLFVAINPGMFLGTAEFKERVEGLVNDIRNSDKCEGVDKIHIPGDSAYENKDMMIDIPDEVYDKLVRL